LRITLLGILTAYVYESSEHGEFPEHDPESSEHDESAEHIYILDYCVLLSGLLLFLALLFCFTLLFRTLNTSWLSTDASSKISAKSVLEAEKTLEPFSNSSSWIFS